jgi:hypothetical protein
MAGSEVAITVESMFSMKSAEATTSGNMRLVGDMRAGLAWVKPATCEIYATPPCERKIRSQPSLTFKDTPYIREGWTAFSGQCRTSRRVSRVPTRF